jgi:hypothetical protein
MLKVDNSRRHRAILPIQQETEVKTAIAAMLLAIAIASPASAGGIKIDRPCGTRGAEPCIVLAQRQTYPSDLKHYEMFAARRSLTPAPTDGVSQSTIVMSYSIQTYRR